MADRAFRAAMRARDVDSAARAHRVKAFSWGAYPGLVIGGLIAVGGSPLLGVVVMVSITAGVGGAALLLSNSVGGVVRGATNPHGRARPRDHSKADAFLARGDAVSAIAVLEASLEEFPDDPEALIRIARIRRDALADPSAALEAFRAARASGALSNSQMRVTIREMLDVARGLGEPARVAADLARQRDTFAGTEEADWAAMELAEVKRSIER